ncbi:MAG: heavy metal-associated domain-containing protein [Candidatus Tectomicrobia bacterium]
MERLDGVQNAEVHARKAQAVVTYDPEKATVQQMIEAVARSGFGAEEILKQ